MSRAALPGFAAALLVCAACATIPPPPLPDAAADAVDRAGNAPTDAERLAILRALRRSHGDALPQAHRRDLGRLIDELDRWQTDFDLGYFGKETRANDDYDFGIAPRSPFHPLTYLYRGRMLTWALLEYGGYGGYERYAKARGFFEKAFLHYPEEPVAPLYLGMRAPDPMPPAPADAPAWAISQRAALQRLRAIILWWVEHRMREDGQYGGGWEDDCEMWRWWTPILIGFEDPAINAAQEKLSRALLNQPHMAGGYTEHMYDVEHTAEPTSDTITPMMHLAPRDPEWRDRALRLVALYETVWTGTNERGQKQFKSTWFNAEGVHPDPRYAADTDLHPRAVQPALLLWQRTRDPALTAAFTPWLDTWVDAAARDERGKPAGILPPAIRWPDGAVGGPGPDWWFPENHDELTLYEWPKNNYFMLYTFLVAHHVTGDERYLEPLRALARIRASWLDGPRPDDPPEGSLAWAAGQLDFLGPILAKYRFSTGQADFDAFLEDTAPAYVAFRMNPGAPATRGALAEDLAKTARALHYPLEAFTSEVRWTDRVLKFPRIFEADRFTPPGAAPRGPTGVDTDLLYATATGDPGSPLYFPLNAVRWHTTPQDIAALVTDAGSARLAAELYHFGDAPRPMAATLYLLEPGARAAVLHTPDGERPVALEQTPDGLRARFTLPPRRLCRLVVASE